MTLYLITSNAGKYNEFRQMIPSIMQMDIHLAEIQHIDPAEVIKAKLADAMGKYTGELIVEDTALCMDCINGLPGALVKWFEKSVGNDGLYKLASAIGNDGAEAVSVIGYASKEGVRFFEGRVRGRITKPVGENNFGWDKIFVPEGHEKTFSQMTLDEKNGISHRRQALDKLCKFLGH